MSLPVSILDLIQSRHILTGVAMVRASLEQQRLPAHIGALLTSNISLCLLHPCKKYYYPTDDEELTCI